MPVFNIALCLAGFMLLALAMARHFESIFGSDLSPRGSMAFRAGGWAVLALAAARAIQLDGPSVGLAIWVGELGIAALLAVLLLTYGSRRILFTVAVLGVLIVPFYGWP